MLVSIFIPTYNAASCIEQTLNSVLTQTYSELEVWLVDDCSSDNTREVLQRYAETDKRVNLLFKEKNEGFVPFSWNRVFPLLQGEFTLYMSHDDLLASDCIERLVTCQEKSKADCVIPDCVFSYDDGSTKSSGIVSQQLDPRTAFAKMLNYDIPGFALWKTDLIRSIGMPTDAWNSDEGMQRIWALNCKNGVSLCLDAKFYYRLTDASITRGLKPYHVTGLKTQKMLIRNVFASGVWWRFPMPTIRFVWQYIRSYRYLKTATL